MSQDGPARPITPTNPEQEQSKGRIALWLSPGDIHWLSQHCCCPEDAPPEVTERCSRVRFRAMAALHKAGVTPDEETV